MIFPKGSLRLILEHVLDRLLIIGSGRDYNRVRMGVIVNIPQSLQHLTGGVKVAKVNGNTVGECLDDLTQKFPAIRPSLFTKKGKLHGYLGIFVNKESAYPEELAKPVASGDELHIVNIIVGG